MCLFLSDKILEDKHIFLLVSSGFDIKTVWRIYT